MPKPFDDLTNLSMSTLMSLRDLGRDDLRRTEKHKADLEAMLENINWRSKSVETEQQNRVRMTAERHWERFDEACHGNAQQMASIAEDAIEELLQRERETPRLRPDLFNKLINEIMETIRTHGATQQCRTKLVDVISKYCVPDHLHTRPK